MFQLRVELGSSQGPRVTERARAGTDAGVVLSRARNGKRNVGHVASTGGGKRWRGEMAGRCSLNGLSVGREDIERRGRSDGER